MGITGSGKSTFISLLAESAVEIGHKLTSCKERSTIINKLFADDLGTADVEFHSFVYKDGRRVHLIDTPGFDDTHRHDTDVLKDVACFLAAAYAGTVQLTGIIYLHRITDARMSGSSLKNLNMFKKLCGEDAYKHVVLGTTMWGNLNGPNLSHDTGLEREKELKTRKDWWGLMCDRGSQVFQHDGGKQSAMRIVESLIERRKQTDPLLLNIQREMIDDKKSLEDTSAGQEVEKEIIKAKQKFNEQITDLQESYEQALKDRDTQLAEVLAEQREDLEKKLQRTSAAQEDLKISFQKLTEEKAADALKWQEQQRQFEERQADLTRLEAERQAKAEDQRKEHARYEKERQDLEQRIQDLLRAQKTDEAERAKAETANLEKLHREFEQRFAWERRQQEQQAQAIQAQMAQLQQEGGKTRSSTPWMGLIAGALALGGGVLTLNPTAIMSGFEALSGNN